MKLDITQIHKDILALEDLAAARAQAGADLDKYCSLVCKNYGLNPPATIEDVRVRLKEYLYEQVLKQ